MPSLKTKAELDLICKQYRIVLIQMLYKSQSGHPGSSLSACEILTALYHNILNINPHLPQWELRDRLVLSKGHCSPMAYIAMADLGYFPKEELDHLRQSGHMLQGHPSKKSVPGVDYTSGPLGLGLSYAAGIAAAAKLEGKDFYTYALLGDGELQEGCIWEALFSVSKFNLTNLITIIDNNGVQLDGETDLVMPMNSIKDKISAFGCNVIEIDGHDTQAIQAAVKSAKSNKNLPTVILAKTVKGKGISFMEGDYYWHGASVDNNAYNWAREELGVEL